MALVCVEQQSRREGVAAGLGRGAVPQAQPRQPPCDHPLLKLDFPCSMAGWGWGAGLSTVVSCPQGATSRSPPPNTHSRSASHSSPLPSSQEVCDTTFQASIHQGFSETVIILCQYIVLKVPVLIIISFWLVQTPIRKKKICCHQVTSVESEL